MPIKIHCGDIFNANAEALVVPANVQPDLGWGSHISECLLKMVEPRVIEERKAAGDVALGGACLTSGAGTPFKYLIHASVLDKYDFNPLFLLRIRQRTSDDTLKAALAKTAEILTARNITSAAISAMGAGIGGMNYRKCVEITFAALKDHPCEIHFAAYKPKHQKIAQAVLSS